MSPVLPPPLKSPSHGTNAQSTSPDGGTCADTFGERRASLGMLNRIARDMLLKNLAALRGGSIHLEDATGQVVLGQGGALNARLRVHDPIFFRRAVLGGSLAVSTSYLNGEWDCDNPIALFRLFLQNEAEINQLDGPVSRLVTFGHRLYHLWNDNRPSRSRENIHAHYDLGNDFFKLMLDETMSYSSGIFRDPQSSLQEASLEKIDRICRKLELRPHDHLLEIGTGWGALAIHAAGKYGCRVTTSTISANQFEVARQRIADAGLSDRVSLVLTDYRDLTGQFDKLVSVEMIEAVGHRHLDTYFQRCGALLKPRGTFVLQGIVMPDRHHAQYLKTVDFIQRYVFPGGCLPCSKSIVTSMSKASDLRLVHVEEFGTHYARTLQEWRKRFQEKLPEVRALGYPERFIRLWNYYLDYCEAAFEERYTGVVQMQFDKPGCRRDPLEIATRATDC